MANINTIPVIIGPTASGKTRVGISLARLLNGEIISVDSRKVYTHLPIGTATPSGTFENNSYWVEGVPHHLMSFLSPDQPYTAGDFTKDASVLIEKIQSRGRIPILVGGTGFYFRALQMGLPPLPPRDLEFRANIEKQMEKEGPTPFYSELALKDPTAAQAISNNDRHKIIRALEIIHLTNQPYSSWKENKVKPKNYPFVAMGLHYDKADLDHRIDLRSKNMVEKGMVEEAENLIKKGFSPLCPALASFGYREAVQVLQGKLKREDFLPALIKGTKSYAKRQRTYFRTQLAISWFDCTGNTNPDETAMKMKDFCEN